MSSHAECPEPSTALVDPVIESAVADYWSRLLSPAQNAAGLDWIKDLVLRCEPSTRDDAIQMLTVACGFASDSVREDELIDWDALLVEAQVGRWAHLQLEAGVPGSSMSQRLLLLRRMLRVRRGLPARMRVTHGSSRVQQPMDDDVRTALEASLEAASEQVRGAYVAGFGAGRIGVYAAGGRITADGSGEVQIELPGGCYRVVAPIEAVASGLAGVVLSPDAWERFRDHCRTHEIHATRGIARVTFAVLALSENDSAVALLSKFSLTRRHVDSAVGFLPEVDPVIRRHLLRG